MAPLQLLLAAAASFALSSASPTQLAPDAADARAAPDAPAAALTDAPAPIASMVTFEAACPLPRDFMRILEGFEAAGITRIDRTAKLVSTKGVMQTEDLPVREASWAPASEPNRLPAIYGRVMSFDF